MVLPLYRLKKKKTERQFFTLESDFLTSVSSFLPRCCLWGGLPSEECILPANEAGPLERTKIALLVTSGAMLLLLLGAAVLVWRKSRSRPVAKGRYEKLAEPTVSYSSYRSSYLDEDQVIEYRDRDYDEDDEDDIVYMGQDGTVYRKFKYGLLDETEEDELEYDDESYSYQ